MHDFLKRVAADKAKGNKPSSMRALVASVAVGAAAAGATYRVLRS